MLSGPIGVFSHIVTDEIFDPAGTLTAVEVGGAGAFAAVGAAMATDEAVPLLVTGVGSEDHPRMASWLVRRGVDASGLFVHGARSPVTEVRYDEDGERVETARYGLRHFLDLSPYPVHAAPYTLGGAYVFRDLDPQFWGADPSLRSSCTGPILWELHAGVCAPRHLDRIVDIAQGVDVLSLNRTEARMIMGGGEPMGIFDAIPARCCVALRMGADGSLVRTGAGVWWVGTAPTAALDPTGGGNAWSGALVASLAVSGDIVTAATVATACAAVVISVPGAPELTPILREGVALASRAVQVRRIAN